MSRHVLNSSQAKISTHSAHFWFQSIIIYMLWRLYIGTRPLFNVPEVGFCHTLTSFYHWSLHSFVLVWHTHASNLSCAYMVPEYCSNLVSTWLNLWRIINGIQTDSKHHEVSLPVIKLLLVAWIKVLNTISWYPWQWMSNEVSFQSRLVAMHAKYMCTLLF